MTSTDHAELARLAEAVCALLDVRQSRLTITPGQLATYCPLDAKLDADAASALRALLAEIAALRARQDALIEGKTDMFRRATQAERQRDEAREVISSTVDKADWMLGHLSGERASIDRETIELVVSECRSHRHLQDLASMEPKT